MSEKKTILFNDSFMTSNNKTRKNSGGKPKKEKHKPVIKPNSLKKTLLEKIKKHQQHEQISRPSQDEHVAEDVEFHNNFMDSLEYLNKLSDNNKHKKADKRKNATLKKPVTGGNKPIPNINGPLESLVSVYLPSDFDSPIRTSSLPAGGYSSLPAGGYSSLPAGGYSTLPAGGYSTVSNNGQVNRETSYTPLYGGQNSKQPMGPMGPVAPYIQPYIQPASFIENKQDTPYGCLKGGNKPTYREYHNKTLKKKPIVIQSNQESNVKIRQQKLADLKKSYKKIRQKKRTIRKSTYKLGKIGGKVSVLIKNNVTRRTIKREHGLLKQKPLNEVKQYLYDKNLIKIGSTAPNDVLRTLYEHAILAGDINNVANDIQLHNFMNKSSNA
jgi:hypothetical protein